MFTPYWSTFALLFAALVLGAVGASRAVRNLLGHDGLLAGFVFVANPFVANKLAAGHLAELVSYATLPWILHEIFNVRSSANCGIHVSRLVFLCLLAASQPQYGIFACAGILLAALFGFLSASIAVAIFGLTGLGEAGVLAAASISRGIAWLHADRVTLRWEMVGSRDFMNAFSALGYAPQYAERLYLWLPASLAVLFCFYLASCFAPFFLPVSRRQIVFIGLIGLCGVFGSMGVLGPEAGIWTFVFLHFQWAAIFREFYHFTSLNMLVISIFCAVTFSFLRQKYGLIFASTYAGIYILFQAQMLTGNALADIPSFSAQDRKAFISVVETLALDGHAGRILFWPIRQPIAAKAMLSGGVDPEALDIGNHAIIAEYQLDPISEHVAWLLAQPKSLDILAAYGVEYIVDRPTWRSLRYTMSEPKLAGIVRSCSSIEPNFSEWQSVLASPQVHVFRNPRYSSDIHQVTALPVRFFALPGPEVQSDDPRLGWVDGVRWAGCFSTLASVPAETLFTDSRTPLLLKVPSGASKLWIWAPQGLRIESGKRSEVFKFKRFEPVSIAGVSAVRLFPQGIAATAGFSTQGIVDSWAATPTTCHGHCKYSVDAENARPQVLEPRGIPLVPAGTFPTVFADKLQPRPSSWSLLKLGEVISWFVFGVMGIVGFIYPRLRLHP